MYIYVQIIRSQTQLLQKCLTNSGYKRSRRMSVFLRLTFSPAAAVMEICEPSDDVSVC